MRIGIDFREAVKKQRTGIGNYVFLLAENLRKVLSSEDELIKLVPDGGLPFWSAHISFAEKIHTAMLDVLHGPANTLPLMYQGDRGNRGATVLTIHDLAIYKHPEWFPGGQWFAKKIVVPRSIKRADHIIVPSETTKKDLREIFKVAEDRITVIPHGVEDRFFVERQSGQYGIGLQVQGDQRPYPKTMLAATPKPYILFVGTLEPRKNLVRLIEAFETLPKEITDEYELVLVGAKAWGYKEILLKIENCKLEIKEKIKILDYCPEEQLPQLMANAAVFVYPSLYEGLGLPVLEAMAAGVPVITSKGTAMEELVSRVIATPTQGRGKQSQRLVPSNDGIAALSANRRTPRNDSNCAVLVDPYSVFEIRDAVVKFIRDKAYSRQIARQGQELARQFTWGKTAIKTLQIYNNLRSTKFTKLRRGS